MQRAIFHRLALAVSVVLLPSIALGAWQPSEIVGMKYPRLARLARITGLVIVRASLADDGTVREVAVVSGHPLLAKAAQANAREWRFAWSQKVSRSSRSPEVHLVYYFALSGRCVERDCRELFWVELPNFIVVRSELPEISTGQAEKGLGR